MMDIKKSWQAPWTLVALALAALSAWGFIEFLDDVLEGDTRAVDEAIIRAFRVPGDPADPIGPAWLEEAVRDITALGSSPTLVIAVLAVAGFLMLANAWRPAIFTLAASGGGLILSWLLKELIDRPRPDLVPHGNIVYTASFPSGHSMMSAVVYLTLAALVTRLIERKRLKGYALGVAMILTLLVGVSRVYLGVHWPSDVLAGWAAGAAWALGCWMIARWIGLGDDEAR
ncbi:phosphatase PAP2 family protein [Dongia deserti]|uniref:phosphatase PAP2 family protein n=1 Tax=Dongia deserti TaxID=2268030 RepID=UPI000E647025|nr:phosphatase PAP2 family protein [Dongia deserti]